MIIYKVKNKIDGKMYIGQTRKTLEKRWKDHCSNRSSCRYLKFAILKYGKENFEITQITKCNSLEEMNHREAYCIKLFNTMTPNGYNLTTGGDVKNISEETRLKKSESMKKVWQEKRQNYENSIQLKKKQTITKEQKLKTSATLTGIKHTEERRKKQSIAHRQKYENGYISPLKGIKRPEGWINPMKGKIGKPNSGSFGYGRIAPLKGRKRVIVDGKIRYIKEATDVC